MKYIYAYVVALVIFLVIDGLWIGVLARGLYVSRLGPIMLDQPRWGVAVVFYALYVVGLVYFAISTGFNGGGPMVAAMNGALFGFFAYLTYNATNLAVFRGYDGLIAVVDTLWGAALGAIVSFLTIVLLARFGIGSGD